MSSMIHDKLNKVLSFDVLDLMKKQQEFLNDIKPYMDALVDHIMCQPHPGAIVTYDDNGKLLSYTENPREQTEYEKNLLLIIENIKDKYK